MTPTSTRPNPHRWGTAAPPAEGRKGDDGPRNPTTTPISHFPRYLSNHRSRVTRRPHRPVDGSTGSGAALGIGVGHCFAEGPQ